MSRMAESALVRGDDASRVASALRDAAARIKKPSGAVVFVSGGLAGRPERVAELIAERSPGIPCLVVPGAGVLTEQGELEDQSAASLVVWAGGRTEATSLDGTSADELGEALARLVTDRAGRTSPAVLAFIRPEGFGPQVLEPLHQARGAANVFGGGIAGADGIAAVGEDARVSVGGAAALFLRGLSPPVLKSSPACRLLMPLAPITETRGSMVVTIDSEPALDVLSRVGRDVLGEPLVFAVLSDDDRPDAGARAELVIRGVQGVDPVRRALVVSDEVHEGMRISFGVRDAAAARADLEAVTRDASRALAGAAPRFGIYVNCAGRGASLYGAPDVDTRILRARFADVPIAGMQSSFELAPHAGRPALQLYTGVLAMFTAPS